MLLKELIIKYIRCGKQFLVKKKLKTTFVSSYDKHGRRRPSRLK